MRRFLMILLLIYSCHGSRSFSHDQIWFHQFSFQLLSQVRIFLLLFSANYVVGAHIFNLLFKGCGVFRNILLLINYFWSQLVCWIFWNFFIFLYYRCLLFDINQCISNYFWWKLVRCFFYNFGIFLEVQCFRFDINQLISNIHWFSVFFSLVILYSSCCWSYWAIMAWNIWSYQGNMAWILLFVGV